MERLRYDEYLAVALSRLHAENNPMISRSELFCFSRENNVYTYSVAMPLRLDYELIESVDAIISNLMEFGLIGKWIELSEEPTTRAKVADTKKKQKDNEVNRGNDSADGTVVLTMDHIIGALLIMAFGYVLAIIAFLVEQIVHRRVERGTQSKFFIYLHRFLRPNRVDCMATPFSVNSDL